MPVQPRDGNGNAWSLGAFVDHIRELRAADDRLRTADMQYLNQRFMDSQKEVSNALQAADKATNKAEQNSNDRFTAGNEIKEAMKDQQSRFITRGEVYALCTVAIAVGGFLGAVVGHFIR